MGRSVNAGAGGRQSPIGHYAAEMEWTWFPFGHDGIYFVVDA
ncbi:hypothetical protein OKW41_001292 [Paraburkholderia sp. UCT70]